MPNFRRGAAAIEQAASSRGGGQFRPFVPAIQWRDDRQEKHVLFLTPVDTIPTVDYFEWIPVGKGTKANGDTYNKYEEFISRKDPAIGEDYDDLSDRLVVVPKSRSIAVAVELEPITENDGKRNRVTGFRVATDTYTRRDEDDNEEEVTQPLIGVVVQSAQNFFGWLSSYDASQGPIEDTPMHVTRRGKDANTTYDFIALEGREVDFSPLFDYLDGVSYLRDHMDDLLQAVDEATTFNQGAQIIAAALLDKRLDELSDKDRYDELVGPIEHIESKFGKKNTKAPAKERPARPQRPSRRDSGGAESEAKSEPEAAPEPAPSGNARFDRLKARVAAS